MIDEYDGDESGWGVAMTGAYLARTAMLIVVTAWLVAWWILG